MGVFQAFTSSLGYIGEEQWKEMFYCEDMGMDILIQRGHKRIGARSTNTRMDDQVITNGSLLVLNEGQALIATANGKIIDICTEPGEHYFNDPDHGVGLTGIFKEAARRAAYGGGDIQPITHRVYYVNIRECMGNPFSTPAPVPLALGDPSLGLDFDGGVMMSGVFSYRITDPALFYKLLVGNISGSYTRSRLNDQIRGVFLSSLNKAIASMSLRAIRPSEVPNHIPEFCTAINEVMNQGWLGQHGMAISSVAIDSYHLYGAAEIKTMQQTAMLKDPAMAQAALTGAAADNVKIVGTTNPLSASRSSDMIAFLRGQAPKPSYTLSWTCSCGHQNTGNFCTDCGQRRPGGTF